MLLSNTVVYDHDDDNAVGDDDDNKTRRRWLNLRRLWRQRNEE